MKIFTRTDQHLEINIYQGQLRFGNRKFREAMLR